MLNQEQTEQVHQIIGRRLNQYRSKAWEDDISRHTLDTQPFENLPSPNNFTQQELDQTRHILASGLLQDRTLAQLAEKDTHPIPCPADREGYSPGRDPVYWVNGLQDHLKIMEIAEERGVDVQSYFDFGCATGRVLRHFAVQTQTPTVWGSDINARHIRWLEEFMPMNVRPIANHCIPSIPIPDNSVDVISAFSVFTHIDTFESCWLAELSRILAPGGFAYLTVHNEATWNVLRGEMDNENNRLIKSVLKVDPEFENYINDPMPNGRTIYRFTDFGPYRAQVFHSNDYLNRVWGRFFNVEAILDCHHVRQTVVLLTKRT